MHPEHTYENDSIQMPLGFSFNNDSFIPFSLNFPLLRERLSSAQEPVLLFIPTLNGNFNKNYRLRLEGLYDGAKM